MAELEDERSDGPEANRGESESVRAALIDAIGPLVLFLLIGFVVFPAGGVDDAHITYWPAYTLAHFGKILNYNGEAIEQSSSPLFVVLLGAAHFVSRAAVPLLGWLLGILCGMGALVMSVRVAKILAPQRAKMTGALIALAFPFTYWSFSGMETSCAAWAGSAWLLAVHTVRGKASVLRRLAPWTLAYLAVRPEAFALVSCTLVGAAVLSIRVRELRASLAPAAACFAVCAGLLFVARKTFFGTWLPQTVLAKSGSPLDSVEYGWEYVRSEPTLSGLLVLALIATAHATLVRRSRFGALALAFLTAQSGFLIFSGGDWMEGGRFFAPLLPVAIPACIGLFGALFPTATRFPYVMLFSVLVVVGVSFTARDSKSLASWTRAKVEYEGPAPELSFPETKNKVHLRDIPVIFVMDAVVSTFAEKQTEPVLILTGQGGMVLYHLGLEQRGAFEVIDRFGLMDRTLSSSARVRSFGHYRLGLRVNWDNLFQHWDEILEETGMREPDIFFDVSFSKGARKELRARGFVLLYNQKGLVLSESEFLPGWSQAASAMIWVKKARVKSLPPGLPRSLELSPAPWD